MQVYRTYTVPRNPGKDQVEKEQKNGRDFIKALIDIARSDINTAVGAKNLPDSKVLSYMPEGTNMSNIIQRQISIKSGTGQLSCNTWKCIKQLPEVQIKLPGISMFDKQRYRALFCKSENVPDIYQK